MRIGTSLTSSLPAGDPAGGAATLVGRARASHDAGLDSLTLGDHHSTGPGAYWQNTPTLGRLLAEWPDRTAGCLFLVPLWHPVLMAEQIGTLASFCGATFVVQTGIGAGSASRAMGTDERRRGADTELRIPLVKALLAGAEVSEPTLGIEGARIAPVPSRPVEWWIGAASRVGIARAARLGDAWYGAPSLTIDVAERQLATYTDACADAGREPARIPLRRDVFVAATDEEAQRLTEPVVGGGYRGFDPSALLIGSPATVAAGIAPYAALGFTDVIVRHIPAPEPAILDSIALLAEVSALVAGL
ncbi:MAG: LLM class flavin-dependent oxidoreductase [Actinomycetota bacterium]|nr:LLM class flavin-dependent oxidoreductase [Actinomycetota bacterium]